MMPTTSFLRSDTFGKSFGSGTQGITHTIHRHLPHYVTHPLDYLNQESVLGLQKRMANLELDIDELKSSESFTLQPAAIKRLEQLLPNFIVSKKDKNGVVQIPDDFWRALKAKITSEIAVPGSDLLDNESILDAWDAFLRINNGRNKGMNWQIVNDPVSNEELIKGIHRGFLLAKPDIIRLIRDQWEEMESSLTSNLTKTVTQKLRQALPQNPHQQAVGFTKEQVKEIKAVSKQMFHQLLPAAQLEALAQAQIDRNTGRALLRLNHFSAGVGAVVNPIVTSPTYQFSKERANWLVRTALYVTGNALPSPHPPAKALTKWDEAGECWCSPAKGSGSGVQLGVLLENDIYPDEVVIEHIPKTATLDPGSTPQQMELFAQITASDDDRYRLHKVSNILFPDAEAEHDLDHTWVRIGTWTYNIDSPNHVQNFPVQLTLNSEDISTRQLVVRAANNWGAQGHTCFYRVRVHGDVAK
jgi:hypothetical protein